MVWSKFLIGSFCVASGALNLSHFVVAMEDEVIQSYGKPVAVISVDKYDHKEALTEQPDLCHQLLVEKYRKSIVSLREMYYRLDNEISTYSNIDEKNEKLSEKIQKTAEVLSLKEHIVKQYNGDKDRAVQDLKQKKQQHKQALDKLKPIASKSDEEEELAKAHTFAIEECDKNLAVLEQDEYVLEVEKIALSKVLARRQEHKQSLEKLKISRNFVLSQLDSLYGRFERDLYLKKTDAEKISQLTFEEIGFSSQVVNCLDQTKCYKLFSALEMPILSEKTAILPVKEVIRRFQLRLREDSFLLALGAKNLTKFTVNELELWPTQDLQAQAKKYYKSGVMSISDNPMASLEKIERVLLNYNLNKDSLILIKRYVSSLLEGVDLMALYINSIKNAPCSWSTSLALFPLDIMNEQQTAEETKNQFLGVLYQFLGRHANMCFLNIIGNEDIKNRIDRNSDEEIV